MECESRWKASDVDWVGQENKKEKNALTSFMDFSLQTTIHARYVIL